MADQLSTTVTSSGHYGSEGFPPKSEDEADGAGLNPRIVAEEVAKFHKNGLESRRFHDLTAEKYLIHIDGEGDNQWADLYNGERIQIPYNLSGIPRAQNNLLRPIVDNMVAYHSTMPFRFVVETRPDRQSRESGAIDQAFANYIASQQNLNSLFAEALYMAGAFGHCPATWIHRLFRGRPVRHRVCYGQQTESSREDVVWKSCSGPGSQTGLPADTQHRRLYEAELQQPIPAYCSQMATGGQFHTRHCRDDGWD